MATPDLRTFQAHLTGDGFRAGVAAGLWSLVGLDWPYAWIAIRAGRRDGAPDAYVLRFELTNYPASAPTATPWDPATGQQLAAAHRPQGELVSAMFRVDWEEGRALYIPCDRVALTGHGDWAQKHPDWAWTPDRDITHYLRLVSGRLNDEGYTGVAPAAG